MFCDKETNPHKLDCECHTLTSSTIFIHDELYKIYIYIVMRDISGGRDIITALFSRLRQVTIMPTHVYVCVNHEKWWAGSGYTMPKTPSCGHHCDSHYVGCVNNPTLTLSDYYSYSVELNVKHLMANSYDSNINIVKCAELATYFPPKNMYGNSYDSDSNSCYDSDDNCTSDNCTCFDNLTDTCSE